MKPFPPLAIVDFLRILDSLGMLSSRAPNLQERRFSRVLERLGSVLRRIELSEPVSAPSEANDTRQPDDPEEPINLKAAPEATPNQKEQTRRQAREGTLRSRSGGIRAWL